MKVFMIIVYFYIAMANIGESNQSAINSSLHIPHFQSIMERTEKNCQHYAMRWWTFYYELWDSEYMEYYFPIDFCEYIAQSFEEDRLEEALGMISLNYQLLNGKEKRQIVKDSGKGKADDPCQFLLGAPEGKAYFIQWEEHRYFAVSYVKDGKKNGIFIFDLVDEHLKMLGMYLDATGTARINFYYMLLSDGGKYPGGDFSSYPKGMP